MFLDLPLERAPRVVWMGVGLHGHLKSERFLLPHAWCLHMFRDSMEMRVNGKAIEVVPGTVTLIAPNSPIEFHFPRRIQHVHAFAHFAVEEGAVLRFPAVQHLGAKFEPYFVGLSEAIGFWSNGQTRASARLWELLWNLSEPETSSLQEQTLVARAREKIELRLGEPLSVAALASELSVSHNYLTRRFKVETGQTVVAFIRTRRVERAVYLLQHTTSPIKAIARNCGLGDFHPFNKILRRVTGQSPRRLRCQPSHKKPNLFLCPATEVAGDARAKTGHRRGQERNA